MQAFKQAYDRPSAQIAKETGGYVYWDMGEHYELVHQDRVLCSALVSMSTIYGFDSVMLDATQGFKVGAERKERFLQINKELVQRRREVELRPNLQYSLDRIELLRAEMSELLGTPFMRGEVLWGTVAKIDELLLTAVQAYGVGKYSVGAMWGNGKGGHEMQLTVIEEDKLVLFDPDLGVIQFTKFEGVQQYCVRIFQTVDLFEGGEASVAPFPMKIG
jgi:hypothetical protein